MVGGDPERGVFGLDCWFPDSDFDCDDFERGQGLELVSFSRCAGLAGKKKISLIFIHSVNKNLIAEKVMVEG